MTKTLGALTLWLALMSPPTFAQQMYMCCSSSFSITNGEARRWAADERARNARNARQWDAEHEGRTYEQCDNFGQGPVNCKTVTPARKDQRSLYGGFAPLGS